jgi:peptidoglycan/LPS O-acetylase OafA/YrhL
VKHIPQLDGFRALACLLVLGAHLWRYPPDHIITMRVFGGGWVGVDVFFVLSGFLITRILIESKDNQSYFSNFYIRRALRIFPVNYILMGIVLFALPLFSKFPQLMQVKHDELWYLFYAANIIIGIGGWQLSLLNITWSLAIEEQFYLIWPAMMRWFSIERMKIICISLIIMVPVFRAILYPYIGWTWCYVATPLRTDSFAWGAMIALGGQVFFRQTAMCMLMIPVWIIVPNLILGNFMREEYWVSSLGYSLTAMAAAGGLWLVLNAKKTIFSNVVLREIGKVSYGTYLYHPLVSVVVSRFFEGKSLLGSWIFMVISTCLSLGVAELSFRYFESPIMSLRQKVVSVWGWNG